MIRSAITGRQNPKPQADQKPTGETQPAPQARPSTPGALAAAIERVIVFK